MDVRDRVHPASQDSVCPRHNELKSIGIHYRPAINNGVGYRFVLGCQQPDYYKGRGRAGPGYNSNGSGQCVVGSVHFYHLQADEVPSLRKMVSLEQLRSALKSKRSDAVSIDRYWVASFFNFVEK